MCNIKMLYELGRELWEQNKIESMVAYNFGELVLAVNCEYRLDCMFNMNYCTIHPNLMFRVEKGTIFLRREWFVKGAHLEHSNCDIEIGEANINNIINTMNIFTEHGKLKNEDNPKMKELLKNNRLMKTKSARTMIKIENISV